MLSLYQQKTNEMSQIERQLRSIDNLSRYYYQNHLKDLAAVSKVTEEKERYNKVIQLINKLNAE